MDMWTGYAFEELPRRSDKYRTKVAYSMWPTVATQRRKRKACLSGDLSELATFEKLLVEQLTCCYQWSYSWDMRYVKLALVFQVHSFGSAGRESMV